MKVLTEDSKIEIVIQNIENILDENNLYLSFSGNGIGVRSLDLNKDFVITNLENRCPITSLPRSMDSERIALVED